MKTLKWQIAQWFELRWWGRYLRAKSKQEYFTWKLLYWRNFLSVIASYVKVEPHNRIVDLGCGPAGIFIAFADNKITAVDPLIDAYEKQNLVFQKADYPNVSFVNSTIEDFSATEKFDVVFCLNAINHVSNLTNSFSKLKQVSTPGGTIILSIDAHNFSFFKHLFRAIPGDVLHPHQYDLNEYKNLLEKDGWKIKAVHLLKKEFFFSHYVLVARQA